MVTNKIEPFVRRISVLEHRKADVVIGIGFVDETSRVRSDRNDARPSAVEPSIRNGLRFSLFPVQQGNRCPEACAGDIVVDSPAEFRGKLDPVTGRIRVCKSIIVLVRPA